MAATVEKNSIDKTIYEDERKQLLLNIYDQGMGLRSAIAHGIHKHSDELFDRPTNNVDDNMSVINIGYDDGVNIVDITLQELIEQKE